MCTPDYLLGTENRRCSFFSVLLRRSKVAREREGGGERNWVTISLNLQPTIPLLPLSSFYTSFLPPLFPPSPFYLSLSLSLSPLFSQFCLLRRHCFPSVLNYEGKLCDRKSRNSSLVRSTNDTNAFSLVQTDTVPIFSLEDASFTLGEGGEERRGEQVVPDVQMISIITKNVNDR